jgi:hypothetical protein
MTLVATRPVWWPPVQHATNEEFLAYEFFGSALHFERTAQMVVEGLPHRQITGK